MGKDGLKLKYIIKKSDGSDVDPNGKYFVLNIASKDQQHREASMKALEVYAEKMRSYLPVLANDLEKWIEHVREDEVCGECERLSSICQCGRFERGCC